MSNTIGSNVFDILVGLGVPWAIQTMCVSYGSEVRSLFGCERRKQPKSSHSLMLEANVEELQLHC